MRDGKLVQHLPQADAHGEDRSHAVTVQGGRILRGLFGDGRMTVNSCHHQAIRPDGVGDGLTVVARADDGTIEAVEGTDPARFLLGVQWHPERIRDAAHRQAIFGAFVRAAGQGGA